MAETSSNSFATAGATTVILKLSEHEIEVKRQMLASYRTQQAANTVFHLHTERFRPVLQESHAEWSWEDYAFENRRRRLKAKLFLEKIEQLNRSVISLRLPVT